MSSLVAVKIPPTAASSTVGKRAKASKRYVGEIFAQLRVGNDEDHKEQNTKTEVNISRVARSPEAQKPKPYPIHAPIIHTAVMAGSQRRDAFFKSSRGKLNARAAGLEEWNFEP